MNPNALPPISSHYNNGLSPVQQSLATGQRINQTADDAAGQAIVTALTAQANQQDMATQNALQGIQVTQIADGASETINAHLQRLNELSIQAQNGTLNAADRNALNTEFQKTLKSIDQIAQTTNYNGLNLLDNQNPTLDIQLGDGSTTLNLPDFTTSGLGISGLGISNPANAANALQTLSQTLDQMSQQRSQFGAQQNGLTHAIDNLANQNLNTLATRSQISDTDYARAAAEQSRQKILEEANIALQAQSNMDRSRVLQLLA